jgi:hypothetical protein
LDEVDIGDGKIQRPTFINANLSVEEKGKILELLRGSVDCFAWNYMEMPGLGRDLVEHRLPINRDSIHINNLPGTSTRRWWARLRKRWTDCYK